MTLNMWLKDDIRNILLGIDFAGSQMAADRADLEGQAFRDGFRTALAAVAVSLGVSAPDASRPTIDQVQPIPQRLSSRSHL